ncbi:MAG TPA: glycosyltransferase family 4 protein [Anaerolineales bacterium]
MARILYFSRDYTPHDHRFLAALAKTGHRIYYLRLEAASNMIEDRPLPAEIEPVQWAGGNHPPTLRDGLGLLSDLRRVIREVKPDLIHAGPIQRSAFLAALTGFRPLVSMSWGYDLLHDARKNPLWTWSTRYTLRHSAAMVGDCDTIRRLAISYGMLGEHIVTFPWGVDIHHFSVKTFKPANLPTFSLLSTRGFEPIYGIDVIARAFVIAARQQPNLHLTMIGDGSQMASIRQIFLVGAVYDRVHFVGQVSYDELPQYYRDADVYLSASHSDGSSISLLEAFACGTPAIVSDIPGNQEWVTLGENGWLFPDGDAEALADAILVAYAQRQNLPSMGRNSRLLAEQRADWEKNFPQLEKAYAIALG